MNKTRMPARIGPKVTHPIGLRSRHLLRPNIRPVEADYQRMTLVPPEAPGPIDGPRMDPSRLACEDGGVQEWH